jgi:hypothetical protein
MDKYKTLLKLVRHLLEECKSDMVGANPESSSYRYVQGKHFAYRTVLAQASRLSAEEDGQYSW